MQHFVFQNFHTKCGITRTPRAGVESKEICKKQIIFDSYLKRLSRPLQLFHRLLPKQCLKMGNWKR